MGTKIGVDWVVAISDTTLVFSLGLTRAFKLRKPDLSTLSVTLEEIKWPKTCCKVRKDNKFCKPQMGNKLLFPYRDRLSNKQYRLLREMMEECNKYKYYLYNQHKEGSKSLCNRTQVLLDRHKRLKLYKQ